MDTEQAKTLDGLKIAIRMETDGKEFYLKTARESSSELGKKILQQLAAEEDIHRRKFEEIYDSIRRRNAWADTPLAPDGGQKIRTIFANATAKSAPRAKAPASELAAVKTALEMEQKSFDLYRSRAHEAKPGAAKDFYETIAGEEQEHQLILADYYEMLVDPAAWFTGERHALDG